MSDYRIATAPFWLDERQPQQFPDVELALEEPDGLLAVGGDLSSSRLLAAYRQGIFPWYSDEQPILWWSPNPRLVITPNQLHLSKSLIKTLRKENYTITYDKAFSDVIKNCAEPRNYTDDTWISDEMKQAYTSLHQSGDAHSVECWQGDQLIGGLYGVAIGKVFFGESMFAKKTDASKIAFAYLTRQLEIWGYELIDCQVYSPHLASLGAVNISRQNFIQQITKLCNEKTDHLWENTLTVFDIVSANSHE